MVGEAFSGTLLSSDFLLESIVQLDEWTAISDERLAVLATAFRRIFAAFPTDQRPNESQTEDDLIWPILRHLGWTASLRQQNLAPRGREDVPDGLLFSDQQTKTQANRIPEEWRRYSLGLALVESKRWRRPLDRRSDVRGEDIAPSTQMLRYLRRADDLTEGALRWGILTNGCTWRLYFQGSRSVSEDFFEIDLLHLLFPENDGADSEAPDRLNHWLRVFALIFGRDSFLPGLDDLTFHQRAIAESRYYEKRVADNISRLVFEELFPTLARAITVQAPDAPLEEVRESTLILLYRLLFVLYAEDRNLLPVRNEAYRAYGLRDRVRRDIGRRKDRSERFSATAAGYWNAINDLCLAINAGDRALGLPPYNGGLFSPDRTPLLQNLRLNDVVIAEVIDRLSFEETPSGRRYINYRDLSVQQLGSIYERLLEYEITRNEAGLQIQLNPFARKGSGSYYTPEGLVNLVIRETIEPLVASITERFSNQVSDFEEAASTGQGRLGALTRFDPAERILQLKICDPAMGSGHFLVSLVDYLTDQVITAMAESEVAVADADYVSPLAARIEGIRNTILDHADEGGWTLQLEQLDDRQIVKRMVLKRCVYGVDKNPMAVELAKVSLWLHTFTVGAPLSFLDHHLRCGDSLFGSKVGDGITKASALGAPLFLHEPLMRARRAAAAMQIIEGLTDAEIAEAHRSREIFEQVKDMTGPLDAMLSLIHALDWLEPDSRRDITALQAFFTGHFGDPIEIARGRLDPMAQSYRREETRSLAQHFSRILQNARRLIEEERFLNWEVVFPGIWTDWETTPSGGFDAIVGNPPWDRMKLQQVEWFAARRADIALIQRAQDRRDAVRDLAAAGDPLYDSYLEAEERAARAVAVARESGEYPLLSRGDVNIYALFVERAQRLIQPAGLVGLVTPIGIGTDLTSAPFFSSITEAGRLKLFLAFENRSGWLFADVHHEDQPTAIVFSGRDRAFPSFSFGVKLHQLPTDAAMRRNRMTAEGCRRINPNTGTIPIFRTERDAQITAGIYSRLPVLVVRSGIESLRSWPVRYFTMFHMTNASRHFKTIAELEEGGAYPIAMRRWEDAEGRWEPLFEGKMISIYNHRYASVGVNPNAVSGQGVTLHSSEEQLRNASYLNQPRYWVRDNLINYEFPYALAFNDVCNTNNRRSLIAAIVPRAAYGNKLPILVPEEGLDLADLTLLLANMNSIVCDYVARQKIQSRNLNKYILEQLPVVPPEEYDTKFYGEKSAREVVLQAAAELTYTAVDLAPFATSLGLTNGRRARRPFPWDRERRTRLRAFLDAVFFDLYGVTSRADVSYIYSTFPTVARDEMEEHGRLLSRDLCLAYLNALAAGNPDAEIAL